ncbi:MAG: Protein OS-9 [Thelocarpon impressellum]|nr:MAG: Protein OS-9 [Thelocarpon impressellum]
MKRCLGLLALAATASASQHVFSVHDDLLAFPQYEIAFSDTFISDADADVRLAEASSSASSSASKPRPTRPAAADEASEHSGALSHRPTAGPGDAPGEEAPFDGDAQVYEHMYLDGRRYLCAIPVVEWAAKNDTAEAVARAEEERELARATSRGWELLQEMEGQCMFYISGWWSYQFCYNGKIRQFHQLPPQKGVPYYPPVEDAATPSYVLGQVMGPQDEESRGDLSEGRVSLESTELQAKGEVRYLVQKLGGGTVCDLTGKPRRIEVQFHCNLQSTDRIGWIKEITTCSYLMVVYTPRLCDDAAFLPPHENKANRVACREVVPAADIDEWKARRAAEAEGKFLASASRPDAEADADAETEAGEPPPTPTVIGGVTVGAKAHVGSGEQIVGGAAVGGEGALDVVATGAGRARGGAVERLTDEQLRRLSLDPADVDAWQEEVEERAGDKGWRLEVKRGLGGKVEARGIMDVDGQEGGEGEGEEEYDEGSDEGSEEGYREEL